MVDGADWDGAGDKSTRWLRDIRNNGSEVNETESTHGISARVRRDVLLAITGDVHCATATNSIPGIANQSGSGTSTQRMHDPAGGVLEN